MPGNFFAADTGFPQFSEGQSTGEKLTMVMNYLLLLLEQLRYTLRNLGIENFNAAELDELSKLITDPVYARIQNAEGDLLSLTLTAQGLSTQIRDAEGNLLNLTLAANALQSRLLDAEGNVSQLTQTAQSLQSRVQDAEGDISQLTQTAGAIEARVQSAEDGLSQTLRIAPGGVTITNAQGSRVTIDGGQIDAANLNLSGRITFGDLSGAAQSTIQSISNTANEAVNAADDALYIAGRAQDSADNANSFVGAWRYGGTTKIDGAMLQTGTVRASTIQGGVVQLLTAAERVAGQLSMTGASSANYAVELSSGGSLRLEAGSGDVFIEDGSGTQLQLSYPYIELRGATHLLPAQSAGMTLGSGNYPWTDVYTRTGTVQTSDRGKKRNIEDLPEKYVAMLDAVPPRRFKMIDGTSGRYHVGFIAQEVEAAMAAAGVDATEFGGFVKDVGEDGKEVYMLRYEEFLGILHAKNRALEKRLERLEALLS